jgi:hypothetical protein
MPKQPTKSQIFGAKVRSDREAYERKHSKPYKGGRLVPSRGNVLKYLSEKYNICPIELERLFTYSRECTHPWNEGACPRCPDIPVSGYLYMK